MAPHLIKIKINLISAFLNADDYLLILLNVKLQHHCCLVFELVLLPKLMARTIEMALEQELLSESRSYRCFNWQRLLFILSLTDAT